MGASHASCKRDENDLLIVAWSDVDRSHDASCSIFSSMKFSQDWAITDKAANPCSTTCANVELNISMLISFVEEKVTLLTIQNNLKPESDKYFLNNETINRDQRRR